MVIIKFSSLWHWVQIKFYFKRNIVWQAVTFELLWQKSVKKFALTISLMNLFTGAVIEHRILQKWQWNYK